MMRRRRQRCSEMACCSMQLSSLQYVSLLLALANLRLSDAFLCPTSTSSCPQAHASVSLQPPPPSSILLATNKAGSSRSSDDEPDFSLFDPDAEGKLQGTGSLQERLRLGADYGSASPEISPALKQLMELAAASDDDGSVAADSSASNEERSQEVVTPNPETRVNLGASILAETEKMGAHANAHAGSAAAPAVTSIASDNINSNPPPPTDGIVLELDTSGGTGNPIADPSKVKIEQYPRRSVTSDDDVPARIQFKDSLAPRIMKSLQIQLSDQPEHFQLIFSDPTGDGMKKRIEYQQHLLTAVKRYRVMKTWDLARRRLDQQSGVIGGVGGAVMQAGSFPTVVQTGVVSSEAGLNDAADTTTIDVQFDESGWLDSIDINGRTIVTSSGYLDSVYDKDERFVCYPEMYLKGTAVIGDLSFYDC